MIYYDTSAVTKVAIFILVLVAIYLLWLPVKCIAYMRAFKLCGHKNPWAAFIPFYNKVVLTECTGQLEANVIRRVPIEIFRFWIIANFLMCFLTFIPFVGLFNFIFGIMCRMFCYKWVYIRLKKSAIAWAGVASFFSCFIGIIPVIIFFTAKSDDVWKDDASYSGFTNTGVYGNTYSSNENQNSGNSDITFN